MNMNFNQLAMLQKAKSALEQFRSNHPKFPAFLDVIQKNAMQDGTIVEITVTTPDGRRYESNLKLKQEDLDLLEMFHHLK